MKRLPFLALLALAVMISPAARAQQGLQPGGGTVRLVLAGAPGSARAA